MFGGDSETPKPHWLWGDRYFGCLKTIPWNRKIYQKIRFAILRVLQHGSFFVTSFASLYGSAAEINDLMLIMTYLLSSLDISRGDVISRLGNLVKVESIHMISIWYFPPGRSAWYLVKKECIKETSFSWHLWIFFQPMPKKYVETSSTIKWYDASRTRPRPRPSSWSSTTTTTTTSTASPPFTSLSFHGKKPPSPLNIVLHGHMKTWVWRSSRFNALYFCCGFQTCDRHHIMYNLLQDNAYIYIQMHTCYISWMPAQYLKQVLF